mgnify:CR=1 FL=1
MPKTKTKSKKKKLAGAGKAVKYVLTDPDKADRKLELSSGKTLELKAGQATHEAELTASEAKEVKEKYEYLNAEKA